MAGYVIGDLNESNLLVSNSALVTVIDCDSMQVPKGNSRGVFRCPVGKPEYTAPELQGRIFSDMDRNEHQDHFALAVVIFLLLMEGVHPFSGVWRGPGDPKTIEENIRTSNCTYIGSPNIGPMPSAISFATLPARLRVLMLRCFREGHKSPAQRPSASEWKEALGDAERNLVTCSVNGQHVYSNHLQRCPWCERTHILKGFDPFPRVGQQLPLPAVPFTGTTSTNRNVGGNTASGAVTPHTGGTTTVRSPLGLAPKQQVSPPPPTPIAPPTAPIGSSAVACSEGHLINNPAFFRYCPECAIQGKQNAVFGYRKAPCGHSVPDRARFCPQCRKPTGW